MNTEIREVLAEAGYESATVINDPDFDDAIIGVTEDDNVVYDYGKMIEILMDDGMSRFDAIDLIQRKILPETYRIDFNPPIIIKRLEDL